MVRKRIAGSGLRPLAMGVLARVNPGDIRLWHPYYPRKVLLHSYHHKGYWFYGKERESEASRFFARSIQTTDTVVEVGAHIGFQTLHFASLVPRGRVLAFEPGTNNLRYLLHNCAGIPNVEVHRQAVGAQEGTATFFEENLSGQNNSLLRWGVDLAEANARSSGFGGLRIAETAVEVLPLDAVLEGAGVQFVKVKIDGGSPEVIAGAAELLRRWRPTLMVRIFQPERERILDALLGGLGYEAFTAGGGFLDPSAVPDAGNVFFVHPDGPVRR